MCSCSPQVGRDAEGRRQSPPLRACTTDAGVVATTSASGLVRGWPPPTRTLARTRKLTLTLPLITTDNHNHNHNGTSNPTVLGATESLRLVGEAFPWSTGSTFAHTRDVHTSVLGVRAHAAAKGVRVVCLGGGDADGTGDRGAGAGASPAASISANASASASASASATLGDLMAPLVGRLDEHASPTMAGRGEASDAHAKGATAGESAGVLVIPLAWLRALLVLVLRGLRLALGLGLPAASRVGQGMRTCRASEAAGPAPGVAHHLLAFPAESNFDGTRPAASSRPGEPLGLGVGTASDDDDSRQEGGFEAVLRAYRDAGRECDTARQDQWWTLVDAAKYAGTSPIDLSTAPADFMVVSFYKIFGFPTGLGALIMRREAAAACAPAKDAAYFGGGTLVAALATEHWQRFREEPVSRWSNGTTNFLGIIMANAGLDWIESLGGMAAISAHSMAVASHAAEELVKLRHANGRPVCRVYGHWGASDQRRWAQGPIVTLNVLRPSGQVVGYGEVQRMAGLHQPPIQLRVGCFCNPGACQVALGLTPDDVRKQLEEVRVGLAALHRSTTDSFTRHKHSTPFLTRRATCAATPSTWSTASRPALCASRSGHARRWTTRACWCGSSTVSSGSLPQASTPSSCARSPTRGRRRLWPLQAASVGRMTRAAAAAATAVAPSWYCRSCGSIRSNRAAGSG